MSRACGTGSTLSPGLGCRAEEDELEKKRVTGPGEGPQGHARLQKGGEMCFRSGCRLGRTPRVLGREPSSPLNNRMDWV